MAESKVKSNESKKVNVAIHIDFASTERTTERFLEIYGRIRPQLEQIGGEGASVQFAYGAVSFPVLLMCNLDEKSIPVKLEEIRGVAGIRDVNSSILRRIGDNLTAKNGSVQARRKIAKTTDDLEALELLVRDRYVTRQIKQNKNLTQALSKIASKTNHIKEAMYSIGFGLTFGGSTVILSDYVLKAEPIKYVIGDRNFDTVVGLVGFAAIGIGLLAKAIDYDR